MNSERWYRLFRAGTALTLLYAGFAAHARGGPEPAPAGDWPGLWGPNRNAGVDGALEIGPDTAFREIWRRPLGGGYSEVAILAGRGYTLFTDGEKTHLLAVEIATGQELWRAAIGANYRGHGGSHDGPISSPVVEQGRVYVLNRFGKLYAYDAMQGRKLWERDLPGEIAAEVPDFGFGTTPLALGEKLIVQAGGTEHNVVALDTSTGDILWSSRPAEQTGYASPVAMTLAATEQVVGAMTDRIFGLASEDGKVLWTYAAFGEARQSPVALPGDRVFVNFWDESAVLRVSREGEEWTVEEVWRKPLLRANYSPSLYHGGHLYGMSRSYLTCVDAATGEVRWRQKVYESTMIRVGGHLAILGEKSGRFQLVEASPEEFRQVLTTHVFTPGARSLTGPAYVDGDFFLRNGEEMVRLGLTAGGESVSGGEQP